MNRSDSTTTPIATAGAKVAGWVCLPLGDRGFSRRTDGSLLAKEICTSASLIGCSPCIRPVGAVQRLGGLLRHYHQDAAWRVRSADDHEAVHSAAKRLLSIAFQCAVLPENQSGRRCHDRCRQWTAPRRSQSISYVAFKTLFAALQVGAGTGGHINVKATLEVKCGAPHLISIQSNNFFAKLKSFLRKAKARTVERLWKAIDLFLKTVSKGECKAYLANSDCAQPNRHML
jgi:hypothetical protein